MKTYVTGFSLIELMITVAIIGVLAGIAYPNYQKSIMSSKRADAKSALLELANFLERNASEGGCYTNPGADALCNTGDDTNPTLPFTAAPKQGAANYTLSLADISSDTFTLNASPVVGSAQEKDDCGTLTLTNTGSKGIKNPHLANITTDKCW